MNIDRNFQGLRISIVISMCYKYRSIQRTSVNILVQIFFFLGCCGGFNLKNITGVWGSPHFGEGCSKRRYSCASNRTVKTPGPSELSIPNPQRLGWVLQ